MLGELSFGEEALPHGGGVFVLGLEGGISVFKVEMEKRESCHGVSGNGQFLRRRGLDFS